jgi:hypothetical protein
MNLFTCFSSKSPSSGRRQYKALYDINTSILHVQCYKCVTAAINIIMRVLWLVYKI